MSFYYFSQKSANSVHLKVVSLQSLLLEADTNKQQEQATAKEDLKHVIAERQKESSAKKRKLDNPTESNQKTEESNGQQKNPTELAGDGFLFADSQATFVQNSGLQQAYTVHYENHIVRMFIAFQN